MINQVTVSLSIALVLLPGTSWGQFLNCTDWNKMPALAKASYAQGWMEAANNAGPHPKPLGRTRATQGRCYCIPTFPSNPRSQAGYQYDPHCHDNYCRSSRDWASQ